MIILNNIMLWFEKYLLMFIFIETCEFYFLVMSSMNISIFLILNISLDIIYIVSYLINYKTLHVLCYMSFLSYGFIISFLSYGFSIMWFFLIQKSCHMFLFEKCLIYYHVIPLYSYETYKISMIKNYCNFSKK